MNKQMIQSSQSSRTLDDVHSQQNECVQPSFPLQRNGLVWSAKFFKSSVDI